MTLTIDLIDNGVLNLLQDMERLNLIRVNPPTRVPATHNHRETSQSLCGAAKDSKLTMERFRQMQEEDLAIESEADRRLWGGA
jgi:hypothetical protein